MSYRMIGAVLVLSGCGGFGFSIAMEQRKQVHLLNQLLNALKWMRWELQYRLTPLPELCAQAGKQTGGAVGDLLQCVSRELRAQVLPDVNSCFQAALLRDQSLPRKIRKLLRKLGLSLGKFDLTGQLEGLQSVEDACNQELRLLEEGKSQRLRSYETLGLCAGAALVILFI